MPKLSIIIVSYNVCHFLEQTIRAVLRSDLPQHDYEIIVVDNNSSDHSMQMLQTHFPLVNCIQNKVNTGFSKANNQGIEIAKGQYILLLNPDTVLSEDTLSTCISFMEEHPNCGALGVRMIDGSGKFLPESKRGLPTPKASFFKIFGFAKLFPKNKQFGQYHLNFLPEFETNKVDILSGAFMFMRKEAILKAGVLDETFFMYGEDIDLSYRIQLAGFDNYYLPSTSIIHYKGESTKKDSVNYVKVFYHAMFIFAKKHFALKINFATGLLIYFAIYLRAFISIVKQVAQSIWPAMLEFIVIYGTYLGITRYWEIYNKYVEGGAYPHTYFFQHLPLYTSILIAGMALGGAYKKYFSGKQLWKGIFIGFAALIIFYAFLPENLRYSRAILVLGAMLGLASVGFLRLLLNVIFYKKFALDNTQQSQVLFIGSKNELALVKELLFPLAKEKELIGYVSLNSDETDTLGTFSELKKIISFFNINEVILSADILSNKTIIELLSHDYLQKIRIKILPPQADFIIGSYSKNSKGSIYTKTKKLTIQQKTESRQKRRFDLISACIILLLYPILVLFKKQNPITSNLFKVLRGRNTWVSYTGTPSDLPTIPPGILPLTNPTLSSKKLIHATNNYYASHYQWRIDLEILIHALLSS